MARALGHFYYLTSDVEWVSLARSSTYNSRALAHLCEISPRQLRRYFRHHFGTSTQEWLNEQRMISAARLLEDSRSVKEVAFTVGFKQVSHFSREFKEYFGLTASQFVEAISGFAPIGRAR